MQARPIRNCKMQSEIPETDNYEQFVFFSYTLATLFQPHKMCSRCCYLICPSLHPVYIG